MQISPETQIFFQILLGVLAGIACYAQARRQGRDPRYWFLWGILFGIFAFAYLILTRKKSQNQKQEVKAPAPIKEIKPQEPSVIWYYLDEERVAKGPISQQALKKAHEEKKISSQTYIWNETLSDWKIFEEIFTSSPSSRQE